MSYLHKGDNQSHGYDFKKRALGRKEGLKPHLEELKHLMVL